jgi:hypothetical protein
MAKVSSGARKTKIASFVQNKTDFMSKPYVGVLAGAFVGVAASLPLAVAVVGGASQGQGNRMVSMKPADDNLACVAPSGVSGSGGLGGGAPQGVPGSNRSHGYPSTGSSKPGSPVFVTKLVGGTFAKNSATITNTAPNSKNIIVNENKITNTNVSSESNLTDQNASSGKVVVTGNDGASGNATSGDATNANSSSFVENDNN